MHKTLTLDDRIICRNVGELIKEPVVIHVNAFNEQSAKEFSESFRRATESGQDIIPIVIDSYGGFVDSLMAMVDLIQSCETTVATIVQGKAMSCGSVLMTCGDNGYRYMSKNSRVMIHEVSSGEIGRVNDMEVAAKEVRRVNNQLMKILARNCGHDDNYFLDLMHEKNHADWYITPQTAKKHKLVNHIGLPSFNVNVSVNMELI